MWVSALTGLISVELAGNSLRISTFPSQSLWRIWCFHSYCYWIYSGVMLRFPSEAKLNPFMCALSTHTGLCARESIKQIPVYSVWITEQREVRGQTGLHGHIDLTFTFLSSICDTVLYVSCVFMCARVWFQFVLKWTFYYHLYILMPF